ncbi:MAG: hypothetical protein F4W95_12810 [Chloroflexi bacterium]|nr:hypothetical protein [Chloroflexota bacterium]MYD49349.1 hypothetical protein [Chloroflexota bacterium]
MPIVQNNINRMNRMLETILDQPIVIKAMTPVQPIANTLTSRYLDYAMPDVRPAGDEPVSYAVVDADGNVSWEGDTQLLAQQPEQRRKNIVAGSIVRQPVSYSVIDGKGNLTWEGDTELLPGYLQHRHING